MNWKKVLTPVDTEEVRPGLFVQSKPKNPNDIEYRVINPICWNGEYRWNKQFSYKNLITVLIIAFLAWSYMSETQYARELAENPCEILPDIQKYCWGKDVVELGDDYEENKYTFIIPDNP